MIEDDLELAEVLCQYLKQFNIEVTNYEEPYLALSALKMNKYDLIILDLTLPGMDGLDVCKEIVKSFNIPIIISSARSDITDKVTALQLGADDYLPKPYDPRELEVRIKTILRRFNHSNIQEEESKNKIFAFDEEKKEITKNGKYIKLTAGEYEVLLLLLKREGFIVSREDIFENSDILNQDYESSGSLAVIINRIRHKIEENPKEPKFSQLIQLEHFIQFIHLIQSSHSSQFSQSIQS
jgi:two-component system OmpR family response regulator